MQKKLIKAEVNGFIKGLITEASPLNFPPNASFDEENFQLNRDGSRNRRLGMGYEKEYGLVVTDVPNEWAGNQQVKTYEWINVAGIAGKSFLVVQVGSDVRFFDLSIAPLSTTGFVGSLTLLTVYSARKNVSFAGVDGKLVIADGSGDITVVSYSEAAGFTQSVSRLKVRDLWGVEHTLTEQDDSLRTPLATTKHVYNLYNQSWGIPRRNEGETVLVDPMVLFRTTYSTYPSNSETVWPAMQMQAVAPPAIPHERLFINLLNEQIGVNPKAAKGYFIIDLLNRGASRASAVATNKTKYPELELATFTTNTDSTPGGATVVSDFAGRVFYAGFSGDVVGRDSRSPDLSNYVAFSRLVRSPDDAFKCYQDGDPTSREGNEIVDTDGGFFRVSGADGIIHMEGIGNSLIIFANNGVWAVTGGNDYGFSATNYKIDKVTDFGLIGTGSVIRDVETVFYWSMDGIYAIGRSKLGGFEVKNITEATIQTFYEEIGLSAKKACKGVHDLSGRSIRWVYSEGTGFFDGWQTKELVLDLALGAFYVNKIFNATTSSGPIVVEAFSSNPFLQDFSFDPVVANLDAVYVGVEPVSYIQATRSKTLQSVRYVAAVKNSSGNVSYTFAGYNNTSFKDWQSFNNVGVDAKAFVVTGAVTGGDSSVHKQVPYLTVHMKKTETGFSGDFTPVGESSCLVSSLWDFADSQTSNKWSPQFQVYRHRRLFMPSTSEDLFDNGYSVVTSKNKLRGRGRAFSMRMETEPNKDCQIIGWNLNVTGNKYT